MDKSRDNVSVVVNILHYFVMFSNTVFAVSHRREIYIRQSSVRAGVLYALYYNIIFTVDYLLIEHGLK